MGMIHFTPFLLELQMEDKGRSRFMPMGPAFFVCREIGWKK